MAYTKGGGVQNVLTGTTGRAFTRPLRTSREEVPVPGAGGGGGGGASPVASVVFAPRDSGAGEAKDKVSIGRLERAGTPGPWAPSVATIRHRAPPLGGQSAPEQRSAWSCIAWPAFCDPCGLPLSLEVGGPDVQFSWGWREFCWLHPSRLLRFFFRHSFVCI